MYLSHFLLFLLLLTLVPPSSSQTDQQEAPPQTDEDSPQIPPQIGPLADLLGQQLHGLQFLTESQAQLVALGTQDALQNAEGEEWCAARFVRHSQRLIFK